jgi:threonine dehydrogenase-like Zn-dependent dehydrogenase
MTTDDTYFERGINLRHGYMSEYYVDDAEFIVKILKAKEVGVLLEPTTVVEKGIAQAYEIQRRLKSVETETRCGAWVRERSACLHSGPASQRFAGDDVWQDTKALSELRSDRSDRRHVSIDGRTVDSRRRKKYGPIDIIFEATGFSPVVFDSMQALGKNGVLVLVECHWRQSHGGSARGPNQS